jgi:hypothetical protein
MFNSAQQSFENFDSFFESLTAEDSLKLELDVTADNYNGDPCLTVNTNGELLYSDELSEGKHGITLEYFTQDMREIIIEISMSGKNTRDTLVENNKIVKDKFILIDRLTINNYDITNDVELFYNKFTYKNNNTNIEESVKSGFWQNSTLTLKCSLPFSQWYQQNTTRNIALSENLQYQDNKVLAEQQYTELVKKLKLLK